MAIVQYLRHAYAMGEGDMACEIEAISREEMRHFDWLSELIVELGGKPTMNRGAFTGITEDIAQNMRFDIQAEQDAIDLYLQHLEIIDDPDIRRLLSRIVSDEEWHRGQFTQFAQEAGAEASAAPEGAPVAEPAAQEEAPLAEEADTPGAAPSAERMQEMLSYGIQHEYTVILQYLYHRYLMPDCEVGNEIEMQAINEMQHLGWLSEEMEGIEGTPDIEHTGLDLEGTAADMLQADIKSERDVTSVYSQQIPEMQDEALKALLMRIRDHEIYHGEVFSDLLARIRADAAAASGTPRKAPAPPKLDSLYGRAQDK
jgi:bacterioferritin